MPKQSTQLVTHTFGGGWATDYGNTHFGSPQNGQVVIPWLSRAENVRFSLTGWPQRFSGTEKLVTSEATPLFVDQFGNTNVRGIYDYWRMGTTLTGVQQIMAVAGTSLYIMGSALSPTKISGSTQIGANNYVHFSTFNDLLIIATNGDTPYSWDQSTFQSLAGTPPAFSMSVPHKGRQWAGGVPALPSRLYYSVVGNPADWAGAGSGSIDIDPGDGDGIVGLWSWKNDLWVFKGPNKLSIHRITGSAPADFARIPFSYGISTAGQNCIFSMGDDVGFWSTRGTCHSLAATSAYGDYTQGYTNYPILSWCRNIDNILLDKFSHAVTDPLNGYTLLAYKRRSDSHTNYPTRLLMMDWRFRSESEPYPRFAQWNFDSFPGIGLVADFEDNTQTRLFAGGYDGRMYRFDAPTYAHENGISSGIDGSAIPFHVETPYLTYGPPRYTKTINDLSIASEEADGVTVSVSWGGDNQAKQSGSITQAAPPVLGTFVLDTDTLGDYPNQYQGLQEMSGEYRSIQYNFNEATAYKKFGLQNFSVMLTPTGESQENS